MQTLIIVEVAGHMPLDIRESYRKKIMKEMEEGLLITDENMKVITCNIQGEIGLEFNKEG